MDLFYKQLETTISTLKSAHQSDIDKSMIHGYEQGYETGVFESQDIELSLIEKTSTLQNTLRHAHEKIFDLEVHELPKYRNNLKRCHEKLYHIEKYTYDKDDILIRQRQNISEEGLEEDLEEDLDASNDRDNDNDKDNDRSNDNNGSRKRQIHDCCIDHFLLDQEEVFTRNLSGEEHMGLHIRNKIFYCGKYYSLNEFANMNLVDYCKVNGWSYVYIKDLNNGKEKFLNDLPNEYGVQRKYT